ncbi:MAG: aminotransferase class IV [Propionibacteriaceae bacterium]|nr:aminotransferase class IV [Propionibacteriaceae bacterium]
MCSHSDLQLLETFAVHGSRPANLPRHLDRLAASARYFGFPFDRATLEQQVAQLSGTALVRVRLSADGRLTVEPRELAPLPSPARLAIDTVPIDPASEYLRHKTTIRDHCTEALARHPRADDVVLITPDGNVTETTIANLVVQLRGRWVTPPVADGCLPGIGRQLLLEQGVTERSVSVTELREARGIALVSSARGVRRARLARLE